MPAAHQAMETGRNVGDGKANENGKQSQRVLEGAHFWRHGLTFFLQRPKATGPLGVDDRFRSRANNQSAVPPPSTTSAAPVMNEESSDARKSTAFAISSAVPTLPNGRLAQPAM